jgi:adenylosuccinate lyase
MGARLTDSAEYAHLWGTDEVRAVFDQDARRQSWIEILIALAQAQAELGIIPAAAAAAIAGGARADRLDLELLAAETRRTSHSMLGFIAALKATLPADAAEHVYYGITVQDLTDTWTVLAAQRVMAVAWRDLRTLARLLADLAVTHRATIMVGRTHAQPGAPITFGWKAASWADEVGRHLERLHEGRHRWPVVQLGGAVGTLGFFGEQGPALRAAVCRRLGLADPGISWLTSRDRLVEQAFLLALVTGSLARIGNEVMELQRAEIGELAEGSDSASVGSITMPHKRNPERSEHLDTLARLARAQAGVMLEAMVQIHERDGRGWKAEWPTLPELCLLTSSALALAIDLVRGLEVRSERMRANVDDDQGLFSERVLSAYAARVGKHRAQAELQTVLAGARADGRSIADAVVAAGVLDRAEMDALVLDERIPTAEHAVDVVTARLRGFLDTTPERWT